MPIDHGQIASEEAHYKGSAMRYAVTGARLLVPGVVLAHVNGARGPLVGEHHAIASLVIVHTPVSWRVAVFYNTLVSRG